MYQVLVNAVLFVSLGLDTFAVALGLGLSRMGTGRRLRAGLVFALAEGTMPLVGFLVGRNVAQAVGDVASYLAIIVLLAVGAYTIQETIREEETEYEVDSLWRLVLLALSVSLDELAVGISLGLLKAPILLAALYIAAQAFVLTLIGTSLGRLLAGKLADRAEFLSGLILSGLALFLLLAKLTGHDI